MDDQEVLESRIKLGETVRITGSEAKFYLLNNIWLQVAEHQRFLQIKSIGLGVYEVKLMPAHTKSTRLVKAWIY